MDPLLTYSRYFGGGMSVGCAMGYPQSLTERELCRCSDLPALSRRAIVH